MAGKLCALVSDNGQPNFIVIFNHDRPRRVNKLPKASIDIEKSKKKAGRSKCWSGIKSSQHYPGRKLCAVNKSQGRTFLVCTLNRV